MKKRSKLLLGILIITIFFNSCSSLSPTQVYQTLPTLTKSKLLKQAEATEMVETNKCTYLSRNRYFVAPIGFTPNDDLKNGARGIDEWVELDGGNSYVLKNFKWVTVDNQGSTQLHIDFDTLKCN
ncbi:hypothetical protein GZ212_13125 [Mangrovimonas sp. CR14]|uniref:hypothetical protein n=1 Tax=Mangrovimonas sp. CR14 TaxID=2706120 RepID=UPI00141D9B76|nr:hypothetical protein [Mangrovimonas sp. CR14]NIK93099.1 hypothetical protein [Mangrovimonas sp. CR14]